MDDKIIIGIFSIVGTILGGCITIIGTKLDKNKNEKVKDINRLSDQVIAYWILETMYAEEIIKLTGKDTIKSIKAKFRKKVADKGFSRPELTQIETEKIRSKYV